MKVYDTKEAARHMKVGQETVRELVKQGLLKGVKFGNGLRISESAIEEFFLNGGTVTLPKKKKGVNPQPEGLKRATEERRRKKQEQPGQ